MNSKECRYLRAVPYPLGTPEWASFKAYAIACYKEAIDIAEQASRTREGQLNTLTFQIILEKTASPLIYLWEKWQTLTAQQKLQFATPEYAEQLKQAMKEAEKALQQAKQKGFAKEDED